MLVISTRNALFGSFITCAVPKSWRAVLICEFSALQRVKQVWGALKNVDIYEHKCISLGHLLLSDQYGMASVEAVWVTVIAERIGYFTFHLYSPWCEGFFLCRSSTGGVVSLTLMRNRGNLDFSPLTTLKIQNWISLTVSSDHMGQC